MSFTISAFAARPMASGMHHPETRRAERFPKIPTGAPRAVRACGKKSGEIHDELKEKFTVVIVTHNMQQASRISDMTAFFKIAGTGMPGKLIEYDKTEKIFSNPAQQQTEDYVSGRFG